MQTTRRNFIVNGLRLTAALPILGHAHLGAKSESGQRILVVLQLSGGNDGLNTVVPHRQDEYFRARPTLAQSPGSLHRLDDDHGLHPSMGGLGRLFGEGKVAIARSIGLPEPNRSHFRALEIWHTADSGQPCPSRGWLGRLADQLARNEGNAMPALHIGGGRLPLSLAGREGGSTTVPDENGLRANELSPEHARLRAALLTGEGDEELSFLRDVARSSYRAAERMAALASEPTRSAYPDNGLSRKLRLVARLIDGRFPTRIFHVELSGFDTHARQARAHASLLEELSGALAAFQKDLVLSGHADRVLTFAFSEFGRRVHENGSAGTDHGAGGPAFLIGERLRPGLHGAAPDLTDLVDGDVRSSIDYRSVYAMLEQRWMGLEPSSSIPPANWIA